MTVRTSCTLITGTSGFIGAKLLDSWHPGRAVLGLSRQSTGSAAPEVQGDFAAAEDLAALDGYSIDALVHLAAVTGGCSEEDGVAVNVAGTRRLLRYLLDQGCRKFVLASSIAATGCLHNEFIPLQLPMEDEHPCLATDAYGLSKSLMEQLVHFFSRQYPDADFSLLRFGAVVDEATFSPPDRLAGSPLNIPFALMAQVGCGDVLRAIELAMDSARAGVRTYNVVAPDATSADPPRAVLEAHFGDRLSHIDWSHYERPGHEHDALYSMRRIRDELGFVPQFATRHSRRD